MTTNASRKPGQEDDGGRFVRHPDFRWLLALPPLAWAAALVQYELQGRKRSSLGKSAPRSK